MFAECPPSRQQGIAIAHFLETGLVSGLAVTPYQRAVGADVPAGIARPPRLLVGGSSRAGRMMAAIRARTTGSVIGLSTPLACAHSFPSGVVNHSDQGCSGEPQRMLFRDLITECYRLPF
jgi:hypothetical protein